MKIAVVGSGIAASVAAYRLHDAHDVTVFEADDRVGGHSNTVEVSRRGRRWAIDTGFIVFNFRTYPLFTELLDELGVASQPSNMSFSVRCDRSGLEYCGSSLNGLFAQRANLLRPRFHRMLREILRFNREAPAALAGHASLPDTLADFLRDGGYTQDFVDQYIVPMGAAIWSADPALFTRIPARFYLEFMHNHGLLQLRDRPQWRSIVGGSREYVAALTRGFRDRIRLSTPVRAIRRYPDRVEVSSDRHGTETFDAVFIGCHSDQALTLLADPRPAERETLAAIPYQENVATLHTDTSRLPRRRRAWASWNVHTPRAERGRVTLTYNMNMLQNLDAEDVFCVTLNDRDGVDPARTIETITYHHPVFTPAGAAAQARHAEINRDRTFYCGAYWRNGFHEDGVASAHAALAHFDDWRKHEELHLRRAS